MPPIPPLESFDSCLDSELPRPEQERKRALRQRLYGMALLAAQTGRLSARETRRLVRYAAQLGLDRFEAALLINGAKFRCQGARERRTGQNVSMPKFNLLLPIGTTAMDMAWCAAIGLTWLAGLAVARWMSH